jgi:hypothetical protein
MRLPLCQQRSRVLIRPVVNRTARDSEAGEFDGSVLALAATADVGKRTDRRAVALPALRASRNRLAAEWCLSPRRESDDHPDRYFRVPSRERKRASPPTKLLRFVRRGRDPRAGGASPTPREAADSGIPFRAGRATPSFTTIRNLPAPDWRREPQFVLEQVRALDRGAPGQWRRARLAVVAGRDLRSCWRGSIDGGARVAAFVRLGHSPQRR